MGTKFKVCKHLGDLRTRSVQSCLLGYDCRFCYREIVDMWFLDIYIYGYVQNS